MGENVLALLLYLSAEGSPIPTLQTFTPPQTAYFGMFGRWFVMYSYKTAALMYNTIFVGSLVLVVTTAPTAVRNRVHLVSVVGVLGGFIAAILSANIVALVMTQALGRGMSWFSREWYCLVLYGIPALAGKLPIGSLLPHLVLTRL